MGQGHRKLGASFQESSLRDITQHILPTALGCDNTFQVLSTRNFIRDWVPKVLTGAGYRGPNVASYQGNFYPRVSSLVQLIQFSPCFFRKTVGR